MYASSQVIDEAIHPRFEIVDVPLVHFDLYAPQDILLLAFSQRPKAFDLCVANTPRTLSAFEEGAPDSWVIPW